MLQQVIKHGTGHDAVKAGFTRPAAGKTGTTNDEKDAWFAGFTPDLLAVVWTGFDKKEELGLTGAQAALPIWTTFMMQAEAGRPEADFPTPPGVSIWSAPAPVDEESAGAINSPDQTDPGSPASPQPRPDLPESDPND